MRRLETHIERARTIVYDGTQLRPHFLRAAFGLAGDAAALFRGACEVPTENLVDLEDQEAGSFIRARDMLHVIVERFEPDLARMVLIQRLLAGIVADEVRAATDPEIAATVRRSGDDVFVGEGKLTVSIATLSPVSALIHFGVNVDAAGAPVRAASLGLLGIPPDSFGQRLLASLAAELEDVALAMAKVRPAHGGGTAP